MATNQAKKALRELRKASGLCTICGITADNGTRCTSCSIKQNENNQRHIDKRKILGKCISAGCDGSPSNNKHSYCDICREKKNSESRLIDKNRKESGLCVNCGIKAVEGKDKCEVCFKEKNEYMKKWRLKKIADGKCGSCGDNILAPGYKSCELCLQKRCDYHAKLKLKVLATYGGAVCIGCGETEICTLQVDHVAGGGNKHAKEIGGRGKMYKWLRDNNFPSGFRILCANCNIRAMRGVSFPNEIKTNDSNPKI